MSEGPIVGTVSTLDTQHLSNFGPPLAALGSHPVEYPSQPFQHVTTPTIFPMVSVTPSGTSFPPASFYAPPSHHLGQYPTSFNNPPSDHQLEMSTVPPVRLDFQVHNILPSANPD